MALSVGAIGSSYGMSFVQPMNYTIKNESEVSDEFAKSGAAGLIQNVPPVAYPNAQPVESEDQDNDPLKLAIGSVTKSQEANRMYNDVAARFQGMTTGYSQQSQALSYGTAGSTVDLFA